VQDHALPLQGGVQEEARVRGWRPVGQGVGGPPDQRRQIHREGPRGGDDQVGTVVVLVQEGADELRGHAGQLAILADGVAAEGGRLQQQALDGLGDEGRGVVAFAESLLADDGPLGLDELRGQGGMEEDLGQHFQGHRFLARRELDPEGGQVPGGVGRDPPPQALDPPGHVEEGGVAVGAPHQDVLEEMRGPPVLGALVADPRPHAEEQRGRGVPGGGAEDQRHLPGSLDRVDRPGPGEGLQALRKRHGLRPSRTRPCRSGFGRRSRGCRSDFRWLRGRSPRSRPGRGWRGDSSCSVPSAYRG